MSLDKIFGLYTVVFLGVTILIGIARERFRPARTGGSAGSSWGCRSLIYVVIGIITRTSNADQYYVAGPRRARLLQRHGHRLGLDVRGVVHLHGRRALRPGLRGPGLRDGLDGRLSAARRLPRPLPAPVRRLHHPGLPRRPLRRKRRAASIGRRRRHRLLLHLSHRPGDGRRPDRLPLHRPRLQRRRLRRAARRALLLGARAACARSPGPRWRSTSS